MNKSFINIITIILIVISFGSQVINQNQETLTLKYGELLISPHFESNSNSINLFIHLHGKASVVQNAFIKTKINGLLITIHLGMLSGPYRIAFSDSNFLQTILDEALEKIRETKGIDFSDRKLNIFFTSFSAGYGGIREILKYEKYYSKIKGIILLDGLHTDYIETGSGKIVNPIQMKDFLRFAKDAVKFKKQFIITHSEIIPDGYSSTTETAKYLIDSTNTEIVYSERLFSEDFVQKYFAFNGNFRVYGFYGVNAADHMKHFNNIEKFLQMFDY